ncbi:MAG: excinuclease ABC subunit UvrC [Nitrososphaeraceae archaeon]
MLNLKKINRIKEQIPKLPGIYLMKDEFGKIIYIGKAKNLEKRIKSYFKKNKENDKENLKTSKLLKKVSDIEFIITDNEIEAFLLESNLIKKYKPIYNIQLKDQQRYTYLKITKEEYPRLIVTRRNRNGDFYGPPGEIYGPFVHGSSRFLSVGMLRKIFKIRICNRLPKKPCLEFFINNCDAPCIDNVTKNHYMNQVSVLKDILSTKTSIEKFIEKMKNEMKKSSKLQNYEKAKEIRDTIYLLENLMVKQKIDSIYEDQSEEYIGIKNDIFSDVAYVLSLRKNKGIIIDRKSFQFDLIGDNNFSSFLMQYYNNRGNIPHHIYVNILPESKDNLQKALEKLSKHQVEITKITKKYSDEQKMDLMNLIIKNLSSSIENRHRHTIIEFKNYLNLNEIPIIIDCFDVSNFGTNYGVGSCIRFVNGEPYKNGYRKFKIRKIINKQDDYSMMKEIIYRRYKNSINNNKINRSIREINWINTDELIEINNKNNNFENLLPNLIVIDGGFNHLKAAEQVIKGLNLNIQIIAIAKKNEDIYTQYSKIPVRINKKNSILKIIQFARDEAHRFALSYNINLRKIEK